MKNLRTFAWAFLSMAALSVASCTDDDPALPNGGDVPPQPPKPAKCAIESFKLILPDKTELQGEIFDYEKIITVTYETPLKDMMKTATAAIVSSENTTVSPDPATAANYLEPVKFTVSNADGSVKKEYTVKSEEKVVLTEMKFTEVWTKTKDEMKIKAADFAKAAGDSNNKNQTDFVTIAVSGDKIVLSNGNVYDLSGNPAGTLSKEGMGDGNNILSLSNDAKNVLVASSYNPNTTNTTDKQEKKVFEIWGWLNGYDKAPTLLLCSTTDIRRYLNASGDLKQGPASLNIQQPSATGAHMCWYSTGAFDPLNSNKGNKFKSIASGLSSQDGTWSQMLSLCDGTLESPMFVYDNETGMSKGYLMPNATSAVNVIAGPGSTYPGIGGDKGWGNYTKGMVRAFTLQSNGKPNHLALFATCGWPAHYFTVVAANDINAAPLFFKEVKQPATHCPAAAFMSDESFNGGYLFLLTIDNSLTCVKLTQE